VVEALVARAEPVARAGDREGPDRRSGERQRGVRREWHLEDAGGDRDERAHDGRDPPDQDADVAPAVEPALRAVEALGRHVQPAAAALEQRAPAAQPDPPADDAADGVAERPGERHHDERPRAEADLRAEEGDVVRGAEDARGDGSRVQHHELARRGEDGVDRHQHEDGVGAVRRNLRGQARGDAREQGAESTSAGR
jgi:hypothetical protein